MSSDNINFKSVNFDPFADENNSNVFSTTEPQREILTNIFIGGHNANCSYNESVSLHLKGDFSVDVLRKSIPQLLNRHQALRSVFDADGLKFYFSEKLHIEVPLIDLSELNEAAGKSKLEEILNLEAETAFDIHNGPLYRFVIVKHNAHYHQLILTFHHVICDGWSLGIVMQDLSKIYTAIKNNVALDLEPAHLFSEYSKSENHYATTAECEQTEKFWIDQYKGNIPSFEFPSDKIRPAVRTFNARRIDVEIEPTVVADCRKASAQLGVSFVTLLTSAFEIYLHRIVTDSDIVVALPAAGQAELGLTNLVGHCVNVLPLRSKVFSEESFEAYVKRRKSTLLDSYDHQHFTFGSLVRKLNIPRDPSRIPLVPVAFNIDMGITDGVNFDGCTFEFTTNPRHYENFEIFINAAGNGNSLILECTHNIDLFDTQLMRLRMEEFIMLLQSAIQDPAVKISHLDLVTAHERDLLFNKWNNIEKDFSSPITLNKWFEETCDKFPNRIAVTFEGNEISYKELNSSANKLAKWIQQKNILPGSFVGLLVNRDADLIVSMLAILKAGCVYVPIDPGYPVDRVNYILNDANTPLLIISSTLKHLAPDFKNQIFVFDEQYESEVASLNSQNSEPKNTSSDLAYIIYTSGSTGKPKGTLIEHRNVTRLFFATDNWYHFNESDVWTMFHSAAFDFSVWEIWGALLYGGKLVIVPFNVSRDPDSFYELLKNEKVTVLNQTPSAFRTLIQADIKKKLPNEKVHDLRFVIFGGEALELESLREWFNNHGDVKPQLVNMYGITETTVHVTYRPILFNDLHEGKGSMIGVPIPDLQVYLLDENQQPVPIGIPGELYVGGAGVGRGYLNRNELTNQRFLYNEFNPFSGTPLYRSGDLARYKLNGDVEYLGRIDNQVKIRGFRIELGEIESVLEKSPSVKQQTVIAIDDIRGDKRLVAYLVVHNKSEFDVSQIREYMKKELPEYMVPSAFVLIDAIPMTGNGKVDKKALPAPEVSENSGKNFEEPKSPMEELLSHIWCDVLGVYRVGRKDNFFELGGHSILGVQMFSEIEKQLGVKMNLGVLFTSPTIEEMAALINNEGTSKPISPLVPLQPQGNKPPLFCIHMHNGNVNRWRVMVKHLGNNQPLYAIQPVGLDSNKKPHTTIEEMAEYYIGVIKEIQPSGPYHLMGLCFSGMVVYEMASRLEERGDKVAFLGMVNNYAPPENPTLYRIKNGLNKFLKMEMGEQFQYAIDKNLNIGKKLLYKAKILQEKPQAKVEEIQIHEPVRVIGNDLRTIHSLALLNYHPVRKFSGNLFIFRTADPIDPLFNEYLGWDRLISGKIETTVIDGCDNDTIITDEPYNAILSKQVKVYLDQQA